MEKAKQVAREFLSHDGKHKTTIDQDMRGTVTKEQVRPHQHENITTAIDKDVHQEHHQTRIQPVNVTERLPEKHTHKTLPVENRTFEHGSETEKRQTLEREAAGYKNTSTTHETIHSASTKPAITGERIHHHVHEHIQPVIQKEVIAPQVVHTTVPVHEVHHAAPVYHEATTLPPKTLEEFKGHGGNAVLEGRGVETIKEFEGCPKARFESPEAQRRIHGENLPGGTAAAGTAATREAHSNGTSKKHGVGRSKSSSISSSDGNEGAKRDTSTWGLGNKSTTSTSGTTKARRASLIDKLNPRKDADGDGKAGFLD